MAKIIFLGTAGSSTVFTKQLRSSGGIILQVEDLQFHLDPGPGSLVKAKSCEVNPHNTTAILVTHNHLNHCNDLNVIVDAMTYSGIEQRGLLLASKSVLEENNSFLTKHHQKQLEKIIPIEKKHKVGIEIVEINALSVKHTDPTAVGFKFYCPRFSLAYTGDTAYTEELVEELMDTDLLILNVPYPGNKAKGLNLDTDSAIKIINTVKPKLAVLTHFGLEMLKTDPILEARRVQQATGIQTIAAKDGLTISPESHSKTYTSPIKGYY